MPLQAVIRNTFLDFMESPEGDEPVVHRSAGRIRRMSTEPAELPGRRCPDDRTDAGKQAAEAEQLEHINGLLRQAGEDPAAAGAGDPVALVSPTADSTSLANPVKSPSDDELLALRVRLGLATGAPARAGALGRGGPQGDAPPCGTTQGSGRPRQWPPTSVLGTSGGGVDSKLSGPCKTSDAEIRAQLQDGLSKLRAMEATGQGPHGKAEGQTKRTHAGVGASPVPCPTTVMIKNIPGRYKPRELHKELESIGFLGTFDFMYLPASKDGVQNAGYAFVNFVNGAWAKRALDVLKGHSFKKHQRARDTGVAVVSVARIQGLAANIQHRSKAYAKAARAEQSSAWAEGEVLAMTAAEK